MRGIWQDLRYGLRQLRKSPDFSIVAIASLALGIGANTAIFSVVNAVLVRPLPYDQPERVVHLMGTVGGEMSRRHSWLAYPEIEDVRALNRTLVHVAAAQDWAPVLYASGEPTQVFGRSVSASYFEIFGVRPVLGRFFLPEEDDLGHAPVVVVSYGYWQRAHGGDPGILGEALDLDGTRYTVVGVAPADFEDPFGDPLVWRSRPPDWDASLSRVNHSWRGIARLRDGVTLEQAQADQDRIWRSLAQAYPAENGEDGAELMTAREYMVGPVRPAVLVLLGAVGVVLLIACANVANLYLTRAVARGREVAVRAALGASRWRIVLQLLAEVCPLFILGGAVGLYLAWAGLDALVALGAENFPRVTEIRIDGTVLVFTLAISLFTGVIFGLMAAYRATHSELAVALQASGRGQTGDRASERLRGGLVVAEIALSLVLLAGGGLLLKSLWNIHRVEPGFRAENVLTLRLVPRAGDYAERAQVTRLYEDVLERVGSLPGVEAIGVINFLPMTSGQNCEFVWPDDRPLPQAGELADYSGPRCLEVRVVSPDYFRAMGVRIVDGRGFDEQDDEAALPVAVVSEAAAGALRELGGEVIGRRLTVYETRDWLAEVSRELVGVVGNVRQIGLAAEPVPTIYIPHAQELDPWRRWAMTLVVRTAGEPTESAGAVLAAVRRVDANLLIRDVQAMESVMNRTVAGPRFRTLLIVMFAGIALLLSAVGVAGVVGYAVSQRVPEIGLRVALGAQSWDIYAAVMSRGVRLTALGLVLGLVGGLAATRILSGLLYDVSAADPLIFVAAALLMVVTALIAGWIPARKALRVDPVEALDAS
jgi:putative ABC transport system permease protein